MASKIGDNELITDEQVACKAILNYYFLIV